MQFYRCKCGEHTAWTSMGVAGCVSCGKCGSNLAQGPNGHYEVAAHKYVTKYDQNTGKPYERCSACMRTREENEVAVPA